MRSLITTAIMVLISGCGRNDTPLTEAAIPSPQPASDAMAHPLSEEVVSLYERTGATYGGFVLNRYGIGVFQEGREAAAKGVPAFQMTSLPKAGLPAIAIPFGLDLSRADCTPDGIDRLSGLEHLAYLQLLAPKSRTTICPRSRS